MLFTTVRSSLKCLRVIRRHPISHSSYVRRITHNSPLAQAFSNASTAEAESPVQDFSAFLSTSGDTAADAIPKRSRKRRSKTKNAESSLDSPPPSATESEAEKYIRFDHGKPLLSDLERLRPSSRPNLYSREYVQQYTSLIDAMCHSFTSRQLREFAREYKLDTKFTAARLTKDRYAEGIVSQQWGWPSLRELSHKQRMETEIITRSFALDPSQLFLIMGKDGGNLLELSQAHRVQISLTDKPLALRIDGVRSGIDDVAEKIASVKESIIEETVKLPSKEPLNPELLERISRTVGAFIENDAEDQVRICARDAFSLAGARRLVLRAASGSDHINQIMAYRPSGRIEREANLLLPPSRYFLYPFINSRPLPWSTGRDGVFRWRRVTDFLEVSQGENIVETGGLAAGEVLTATQEKIDLRRELLDGLSIRPEHDSSKTVITASTGHLLFGTEGAPQNGGPSLVSNTVEPQPYSGLLNWIADHRRAVFVPSLPPHFLKESPKHQRFLHRLVYQKNLPKRSAAAGGSRDVLRFEITLPTPRVLRNETVATEVQDTSIFAKADLSIICEMGQRTQVDLLLPDRSMDIQFSAMRLTAMPSPEAPSKLLGYASNLEAFLTSPDPSSTQPNPPLALQVCGEEYVLHQSTSVRQSEENLHADFMSSSTATTESALDLESGEKSTVCVLTCEEHSSTKQWSKFLKDCDYLTTSQYGHPASLKSNTHNVLF